MVRMTKKGVCSLAVTASLILGVLPNTQVAMAKGNVKLSKKSITLSVGKSKSVSLKGVSKKVRWYISSKKIVSIRVTGKYKKKCIIKGEKEGSATLKAVYNDKKYRCKVQVRSKSSDNKISVIEPNIIDSITSSPEEVQVTDIKRTDSPSESSSPSPTDTSLETKLPPSISQAPEEGDNTQVNTDSPTETDVPEITDTPYETTVPESSPTPSESQSPDTTSTPEATDNNGKHIHSYNEDHLCSCGEVDSSSEYLLGVLDVSKEGNDGILAYAYSSKTIPNSYEICFKSMDSNATLRELDSSNSVSIFEISSLIGSVSRVCFANKVNAGYSCSGIFNGLGRNVCTGDKFAVITGLSNLVTKNTTDMSNMFKNAKLESIDWNFDSSNVTNMESMFEGCTARYINLEVTDTSKLTNMKKMFMNTYFLMGLSVSDSFDSKSVKDMSYLFTNSSTYLRGDSVSLDTKKFIESLDTSSVTNMELMFAGFFTYIDNLTLNLSGYDTSNVVSMKEMFRSIGGTKTTELNLNFDTSSVLSVKDMFKGVSASNTAIVYLGDTFSSTASDLNISDAISSDTSLVFKVSSDELYNKLTSSIRNWGLCTLEKE